MINISASIGLVNETRSYCYVTELLNDADQTMYRAKDDKQECTVVFNKDFRKKVQDEPISK